MNSPLTLRALAELLAEAPVLDTVPASDPDQPFVLDSLGLTWLVHLLEDKHGITVDLDDSQLREPTTLRRLLGHVNVTADREGVVDA
ncbi:hypothetical protein [Krasilnikovia sp. M28-CT-15]|uniref:hypothetical protein n=1 Tax=Krasilnikovia sp. M28-CT-15 TaxID=3373540 RepID=UPI003877287F